MKIIEPKVELWQQGDDAKAHVARCARVSSRGFPPPWHATARSAADAFC